MLSNFLQNKYISTSKIDNNASIFHHYLVCSYLRLGSLIKEFLEFVSGVKSSNAPFMLRYLNYSACLKAGCDR